MRDPAEDLVTNWHPEKVERMRASLPAPPQPLGPTTIHYTQLPDGPPGSPITTEWNFYRRLIGRFLEDGHEGKWLLIHEEEIVGIWPTQAEANAVRLERYPQQPVLMRQILSQEPILRIGYNRLCRS